MATTQPPLLFIIIPTTWKATGLSLAPFQIPGIQDLDLGQMSILTSNYEEKVTSYKQGCWEPGLME